MDNLEKDIEIIRQRGSGDQTDDVEECRRHIELIVELCKDIKDTCHQDVRKVFARAAETLEEQLSFVRRNEMRINKNSAEDIVSLNKIT